MPKSFSNFRESSHKFTISSTSCGTWGHYGLALTHQLYQRHFVKSYQIGAVFYVLWGLLHVGAGLVVLFQLVTSGGSAALALIGSNVPPDQLPQIVGGVEAGVLGQHAWNLVVFGLFAAIVGVMMNWKNSRSGFWLNLGIVSGADLGFICAIMIPGYITFADGVWGPVFWIGGVVFTTLGVLRFPDSRTTAPQDHP